MNLFNLSGKTALVLGGNGVLGSHLAEGLAEHGANVVIAGRDEEKGRAVVERTTLKQLPVAFHSVDVTRRDSMVDLLQRLEREHESIDVLVNCAGVNSKKPFFEVADEDWETIMAVNARSVFTACQVFGQRMVQQGRGSIINISSVSSGPPLSGVFAYSASKAAVNSMTQYLARELAPHVRVNAIIPGFFPAEQNRKILTKERIDDILRHTPMHRLGEAQELKGVAVWLASEAASGFVTGALIPVDGGFTAMTI